MTLDKILVGHEDAKFARGKIPDIANVEADFTESPDEFVRIAIKRQYSAIVAGFECSGNQEEVFNALRKLKLRDTRKVLWVQKDYDNEIWETGESFGAEVLGKDEICSLAGMLTSHAPLARDGNVLVYPLGDDMKTLLATDVKRLFGDGRVVVSSDLESEIKSQKYGMVIDTSTIVGEPTPNSKVVRYIQSIDLNVVPRVVPIYYIMEILKDVLRISAGYLARQK